MISHLIFFLAVIFCVANGYGLICYLFKRSIIATISTAAISWAVAAAFAAYLYAILGWQHIFWIVPIVLAVIVFTLFYVNKKIGEPLKMLVATIHKMSEGDLTQAKIDYTANNELGDLVFSYNELVHKQQNILQQVMHSSQNMASVATELSATASQLSTNAEDMTTRAASVASAAEQATSNIGSISAESEEMSQLMGMVASAIDAMTATIDEVAGNGQKELEIAVKAGSEAQNGKALMTRLGETAQSIGKIVDVINDIADQTNLLALNATIEAARAGEAGKGFAVVANEIKELAKQTAEATKEIEKQIAEMQTGTDSAITAIDAVANVIDEVNSISQTVVCAVEEQKSTIDEIAQNINQSSAGSREITKNMATSANDLRDVSNNISVVSNSVANTSDGIMHIKESTLELSQLSETLDGLMQYFKINLDQKSQLRRSTVQSENRAI